MKKIFFCVLFFAFFTVFFALNSTEATGYIGTYEDFDKKQLMIREYDGYLQVLLQESGFQDALFSERKYLCYDFDALVGNGILKFVLDESELPLEVVFDDKKYTKKLYGTEGGKVFRIQPLFPVEDLKKMALESETVFDENKDHDLVEIIEYDDDFLLDIRYATYDNFMGIPLYTQSRAFLQRDAALALAAVNASLKPKGLGLVIYDAYRPWYVTKMFWDATPENMKQFVADPETGSRHNRGCAVDVSLYLLESGDVIYMGGGYDEFSERSYPDYPGGTSEQRYHRELLKEEMERQGFRRYEYEWWHFDYRGWEDNPVLNIPFEDL